MDTPGEPTYGSTPANVTFADSPVDGDLGLAPEITVVQGGLDGSCNYSVVPGLTAGLISGDAVFVYIDRDNNAATGSAVFTGADVVVGTLGYTGLESAPLLGVWNGGGFSFTDPTPVGAARTDGGFSTTVDRLGIAPGAVTNLVVGTIYSGIYDDYFDFAPEAGMPLISLSVAYSTTPLPPPPAPPAPPAAQRTQPAGCVVPNVRGRTAWAAKNRLWDVDCDFKSRVRKEYSRSVRKGRVIRTTPRAGTRTTTSVRLVVSKGRRKQAGAAMVPRTALARLEELANASAER